MHERVTVPETTLSDQSVRRRMDSLLVSRGVTSLCRLMSGLMVCRILLVEDWLLVGKAIG